MTLVGALGVPFQVDVDPRGWIHVLTPGFHLDWWIGAEDRWRRPAEEVGVRQELVEAAPIVRTSMRVPGGDVIQTVSATSVGGAVLTIDNPSPGSVVVALVAHPVRSVSVDGDTVILDGVAVQGPRAAGRWAIEAGPDALAEAVLGGQAQEGPVPTRGERRGMAVALLWPLPHRATTSWVLGVGNPAGGGSIDAVARGWRAVVNAGARVVLPDDALNDAVGAARAQALLLGCGPGPVSASVVAALEDWGHDDEAARAWSALGWRARRAAARRPRAAHWPGAADAELDPAGFLLAVRDLLAREDGNEIELLRRFPPLWRGASLEVHDLAVRAGPLSFAVRWHGERPALLYDAPPGVTLRAPGLDRDWSATGAGDALLGAPASVEAQGQDLAGS